MVRRMILPVVAAVVFASSAAWGQSKNEDLGQSVPQKIRERLTAQGYEDVKIAPSSYVVSAKDKDGHRVMMMISPTSMTTMKLPDTPSTAQMPDTDKDEIIQQ